MTDDYYVYVYIDPRNFEEFYYGKGKDHRKDDHLTDEADSEKTRRINSIKNDGLEPIIRVIARGLTQSDAFLVEKTLLWKLGRTLTNQSTGSFSEKFRPPNKLHLELSGFDYLAGIYYFNVGEGPHRSWSDCKRLGFISAGQGVIWRDAISGFREGDLIAAYLKKRGFVGIGRVIRRALPIRKVTIQNLPLIKYELDCKNMFDNIDSDELCEHVALVDWIRAVEPNEPKWKAKSKLYTTPLVRASLEGQPDTLRFLESEFGIDFKTLRERRA
ncbi:MAG TPA: GIY-YIG nuclease family protein [Acidobacteriaceae bacterium]|jgi:hypothetical protein|nr:GIY-YIG nuclease family protein [Acidobacteriaceae bacterium]